MSCFRGGKKTLVNPKIIGSLWLEEEQVGEEGEETLLYLSH